MKFRVLVFPNVYAIIDYTDIYCCRKESLTGLAQGKIRVLNHKRQQQGIMICMLRSVPIHTAGENEMLSPLKANPYTNVQSYMSNLLMHH